MVRDITQSLFDSLTQGEYQTYITTLTNQYFPFGIFWWVIGLTMFAVIHLKVKNFAYSGMITLVYFAVIQESGLVTNIYSVTAMRIFTIILGAIVGWYLYRMWKGGPEF